MIPRTVRIHPDALEEAGEAANWYAQRSVKAPEMFLDELDRLIERISEHPEHFPVMDFGARRAPFRRFPYLVIFRETAEQIEIIAVAHGRRRPGYWRTRK